MVGGEYHCTMIKNRIKRFLLVAGLLANGVSGAAIPKAVEKWLTAPPHFKTYQARGQIVIGDFRTGQRFNYEFFWDNGRFRFITTAPPGEPFMLFIYKGDSVWNYDLLNKVSLVTNEMKLGMLNLNPLELCEILFGFPLKGLKIDSTNQTADTVSVFAGEKIYYLNIQTGLLMRRFRQYLDVRYLQYGSVQGIERPTKIEVPAWPSGYTITLVSQAIDQPLPKNIFEYELPPVQKKDF